MSNQSKNISPLAASAYAPGRVELLGNHTDYNEGVVLGAAIDRGLTVRGRKRDDGMISIESSTMGHVEIARSALRPLEENRWANYALGVANELIALSIPVEGFLLRSAAILRRVADYRVRLRSNWRPLCFY
jgi:galactokinase